MFSRRPLSVTAIALTASLTAVAPAVTTQAASPNATARLEARTAIFAAVADLAAGRSSRVPDATSQPAVASGTAAAGVAAAEATPQTPATEHDPAKVALGAEIFANLKMAEIAAAGVKIGMAGNAQIQAMSEPDRQRLFGLVEEEILKRKDAICARVAEANVDRFTLDQLKIILNLSRIKFVQDSVLHGAGLLPMPDPAGMTPAEQSEVNTYGNAPYVSDFMVNSDLNPMGGEIRIALRTAFARYSGAPAPVA